MSVEWAEPSTVTGGRAGGFTLFTAEVRAEFRAHPKRWGIVQRYSSVNTATSMAAVLRRRGDFDPSEWEFTSRTEDERGVLYARFIGEPDS